MFIRYHLPTLLWALFILIICAIPGERIPKLTFLEWLKPDKIVHLLAYGLLCILLLRSLLEAETHGWQKKNAIIFSLVISTLYGSLIEILQARVFINRSGDFRDVLADALGAILGWLIYRRFIQRKESKTEA